jgi:hypothetical protein
VTGAGQKISGGDWGIIAEENGSGGGDAGKKFCLVCYDQGKVLRSVAVYQVEV